MPTASQDTSRRISTVNEKPLHAALKKWYARPNDRIEVSVDGFLVDIVRPGASPVGSRDLLIEIQTGSFAHVRRKLLRLTARHAVRLVYPIAREKWIVRLAEDGRTELGRRKSPKRRAIQDLFDELVSLPRLLSNPNFSLETVLVEEEEVRRHEPGRAWRRKGWVTQERRLVQVVDQRLFETPADVGALIPSGLAEPFTTAELAATLGAPRRLAQKMAYCLREMGAIETAGKRGNAILYTRARPSCPGLLAPPEAPQLA